MVRLFTDLAMGLTIFIALICFANSVDGLKSSAKASACNSQVCKLPDCFCSGTKIPGDLNVKDVPQMVMITFDDAVNVVNFNFYRLLFNDGTTARKNPNNCNVTVTFFLSHQNTDYRMVQMLRHWRHEIADHSITHRTPTTWWKDATYEEWRNEIDGQREILRKFGKVDNKTIRGFRAPFLQLGGDRQFKALFDGKMLYDSSMPTAEVKTWPYTFDYKSTQECVVPPCPTASWPGLWEIPMTEYTDSKGIKCSMVDQCTRPTSANDTYNLLMSNFMKHYESNRSPFPIFMHSAWFNIVPAAFQGMKMFLEDILKKKDVFLVTLQQAIAWVRNPTPLSKIDAFIPWQCNATPPPAACQTEKSCEYVMKGTYQYLRSCVKTCPKNYPWYGNPDGD